MEPPKKNFVMNLGAVGKSIFYRMACDCTDPDCDLTMEFEANPNDKALYVYLSKKLRNSAYWGYSEDWELFDCISFNWLRILINKFKMCWQIVVNGYIEVEETFIIKEEHHINSFFDAVEEGVSFIEALQEAMEEDKNAQA